MKKSALAFLVSLFCIFSLTLAAADFWQSKPYTGWSNKDLQKIMTNSPWARTFTLSPGSPAAGGGSDSAPAPISEGGGGRGGRGGRGKGGPDVPSPGGPPALDIVARWQSALPLRQAFVRLRYGAEAATSSDAKAILDQAEPAYVVILSGPLQSLLRGNPEDLKTALMNATFLTAKGKSDLKPADVKIDKTSKTEQVIFSFPRTTPYTIEDREIDLNTKLGALPIKYKFHPKDMVFN